MTVLSFRSMNGRGFDEVEAVGESDSHEKGCDEFAAVVTVEVDFGQQVAQRNAQKRARGKRKHIADDRAVVLAEQPGAPETGKSDQRAQQGKSDIGGRSRACAVARELHHAYDGIRIERLVKHDGQENAESGQRPSVFMRGADPHAGTQGDAFGYGMHAQAHGNPYQASRVSAGVTVVGMIVQFAGFIAEVVLMEMEHAQQEDHQDHAENHPCDGFLHVSRAGNPFETVRQEVVHGNTEDKARYETHQYLNLRVCHGSQDGQFSAGEGNGEDAQ